MSKHQSQVGMQALQNVNKEVRNENWTRGLLDDSSGSCRLRESRGFTETSLSGRY